MNVISGATLHRDMPAGHYFADPCASPSLTASIAKILDQQSPAHAWAAHPRLGRESRPASRTMTDGTIVHAMLLGRADDLYIVTSDDYRTKVAREQRDYAISQGKTPILSAEYDRIAAMCSQHLSPQLPDELRSISRLDTEVSLFWTEPSHRGPVQCRGRLDAAKIEPDRIQIWDLKTCASAHPDKVNRSVDEYGYAIQQAAYENAVRATTCAYQVEYANGVRATTAIQIEYTLLFLELEPPFVVTPIRLSEGWRTIGEQRWRRALETWAACLARGRERRHWPAYPASVVTPPPWVVGRELERSVDMGTDLEVA